jgi:integrase
VIRLLLHNALRVDEALGADITDLGSDRGHQVLTVLGKGNRRAKVATDPRGPWVRCTPTSRTAPTQAGIGGGRGRGGSTGGARCWPRAAGGGCRPGQLWELVAPPGRGRRGSGRPIGSPRTSLRHTAITMALDAGVPLRDVQDYARHRECQDDAAL